MFKNEKYNNFFSIWLLGLITLVITIIIVGGLTRLTESGLSITKWELIKGIFPPITQDHWEKYFLEYKSIPQYIYLNPSMSMDEFKIIFYWEYFHRILGRLIGLFFFIPFIFLVYKKVLNSYISKRLIFLSFLILLQGFVGWYMVISGLTENLSVSHYRLSFHLITAFIILSLLFWLFMNHYYSSKEIFFQINERFISLKILLFLIFSQIIIGALVSGLDAGLIYQTWPLMNESYVPSDNFSDNIFNFNNPSTVQFFHRNMAYLIFFLSIYLGISIYKNKIVRLYNSYLFFILFIALQILIGIFVLVSNVNIYVASLHQISSIFLILSSLNLYYRSIRSN